jgi:protein translocase SecG subunit
MDLITIGQIATSLILIVLILLQEKSSSGGLGFLGTDSASGFYQTRRGLEKVLFYATVLLVVIFAGLALLNLVI